jgi:hypothetical protein
MNWKMDIFLLMVLGFMHRNYIEIAFQTLRVKTSMGELLWHVLGSKKCYLLPR